MVGAIICIAGALVNVAFIVLGVGTPMNWLSLGICVSCALTCMANERSV